MTFSIAGRCARTGGFGVAIATSSIAVGARCPHARAGVGAVATQNVTDPALGPLLLDFLRAGLTAAEAVAKAVQAATTSAIVSSPPSTVTAIRRPGRESTSSASTPFPNSGIVSPPEIF